MANEIVLELKGLTKSFAQVKVLTDVTLSLKKGHILGLVGENGAGKSTMMNILGGVLARDGGEILMNGQAFEPKNPKAAQKAGIAFIHQELNLFSNLSVAENLYIADMPKIGIGVVNFAKMKKSVKEIFTRLGIDDIDPDAIIGTLPMGQRQLVEIAKAIVSDANIIILDEPTTSLSTKEKAKLFKIMHDLKDAGKSLIFISHILEDIFEHCNEIVVLRDGQIISQKAKDEVTKAEVIHMMVGRELNKIYPTIEKEVGGVVFEGKDISQAGRFDKVSIKLNEGEIVGVFGLMGAGRTEYLRCLFGVDSIDSGEIIIDGEKLEKISPESCIEKGMAFITENRREEGLLMSKTVKENIVLASVNQLTKKWFGFMDTAGERDMAIDMAEQLKVKTFDPEKQVVVNLSGGNQQKVVLSKWVTKQPKVFLLDEPTRGVDVGAKYEIYSIINELAKNKSTVLMVSSEMEELMGMCDRILVMSQNKLTAEFSKEDFNQEKMIIAAIGDEKNG